ncbi:MAG: type II secretion system protein [Pseudomonadales bacterium]|nr:type II secretion system protein [Pseudomonadales bacterium]
MSKPHTRPSNVSQQGFTLIELIMVIVILGILAAFALPRFADLGGQARASTIEGVSAAIRSASAIAHAQWLVEGDSSSTSISIEGTTIAIINGYPQALGADAGILAAAQVSASTTLSDATDFHINGGTTGALASSDVEIQAKGASTPANCSVNYDAANTNASPVITVVVTGC